MDNKLKMKVLEQLMQELDEDGVTALRGRASKKEAPELECEDDEMLEDDELPEEGDMKVVATGKMAEKLKKKLADLLPGFGK